MLTREKKTNFFVQEKKMKKRILKRERARERKEGRTEKDIIHYVSDRNHWVRKTIYPILMLFWSKDWYGKYEMKKEKENTKKAQKMYKSKTNNQKKRKKQGHFYIIPFFLAFTFLYQTLSGWMTWGSLTLFAVRRQSADERRNGTSCIINGGGWGGNPVAGTGAAATAPGGGIGGTGA